MTEPEKVSSIHIKLPNALLAKIGHKQADILEREAKKISLTDALGRAITLWLEVEDLGFFDAIVISKLEKARAVVDKRMVNGVTETVEIKDQTAVDLLRAVKKGIDEG